MVYVDLTWLKAREHLLPIITNLTNLQLQVRLETMAESTNALPMLPHYQKTSQMVPWSLEDTPGEGETCDSMTGGNDFPIPNLECGSPLRVQSAQQTGHWGDHSTSISASAVLHPLPTQHDPKGGWHPGPSD